MGEGVSRLEMVLTKPKHTLCESWRVPVTQLCNHCLPEQFSFETTADFQLTHKEIIGQKRAVEAMEFGLAVEQTGYNLFVVGASGTGRTTYTKAKVAHFAKDKPVPKDWVYVYNFKQPDQPIALSLPAGEAGKFQATIHRLERKVEHELQQMMESHEFEEEKRSIMRKHEESSEELWKDLRAFAKQENFMIERTPNGFSTYPLRFGRPMKQEEFNQLSDEMKEELKKKGQQIEERMENLINQMRRIETSMREELEQNVRRRASATIAYLFDPLNHQYEKEQKILQYLRDYQEDVVNNVELFVKKEEAEPSLLNMFSEGSERRKLRYKVNVLVHHDPSNGAPVVMELNPTASNLMGRVEYQGSMGNWVTDFTQIKAGALHQANGGYLILQATELLQQPYAWAILKRTLKSSLLQMENLFDDRIGVAATSLKPEAIPIELKVILIGTPDLYQLLAAYDEDFHKLFKVKVEFALQMERNEENLYQLAAFIKNYGEQHQLLPFHRRGVARVIDFSSRLVEDQRKLSTRFQEISKLLVESSFWAEKEGATFVDENHIRKALQEQRYRANRLTETWQEMIADGTLMVDTEGERVGQINGLTILSTGDAYFGLPSRITAQTFLGRSGIMHIERETAMSGQIHNKGLLILSGYLSGQFAQNRPLPLSASITFEQTYNMVDGDSASSSELYILLSSLANAPIKQGIAVTGSVNQWGEIQPIGGVNEKIEGFYHICKLKGFSGEQGVIIPEQNVKHLMLNDEVVEAIRTGQFHLWAVCHVAEGIEILTGIPAGAERDEAGHFPEGTIYARVDARLNQMFQAVIGRKNGAKKNDVANQVEEAMRNSEGDKIEEGEESPNSAE